MRQSAHIIFLLTQGKAVQRDCKLFRLVRLHKTKRRQDFTKQMSFGKAKKCSAHHRCERGYKFDGAHRFLRTVGKNELCRNKPRASTTGKMRGFLIECIYLDLEEKEREKGRERERERKRKRERERE